jgi:hypothetical protein
MRAGEEMRIWIRLIAASIIVGASLHANKLDAIQEVKRLNLVVRPFEYYGTDYVDPPQSGQRFVFFAGEPLVFALQIGNATDDVQTLRPRVERSSAFTVSVLVSPNAALPPRLELEPSGKMYTRGVESVVQWTPEIEIAPRAQLTWLARVTTSGEPGTYELETVPAFTASSPINPQSTRVRYELRRPATIADDAELARRSMMHAFVYGSTDEFEAANSRLLQIYSESSAALELRSLVAERQTEAVSLLEQAVALVTSGRDRLFLAHASSQEVRKRIEALTRRVSRLRA